MNVTVLGGSGQMGRVAVRAMLERGIHVTVADLVPPPESLAGATFTPCDGSAADDLRRVIEPADAVMNFVGPYYRFGTKAARCAIDLRTPYVDVCDDADVTIELLELDAGAVAAGVPLVTGAGGSPGVLNALACIAAAELDEIEQILTAWAIEPHAEGGPAVMQHTIHCVADPISTWRDGALVTGSALAGDAVPFAFPAPMGTVRVHTIGHPEPVTLGPHLRPDHISTLGGIVPDAGLDAVYRFARLGLGSTDPLQIGTNQITPREFLAAYMISFNRPSDPAQEKVALGVEVAGRRAGRSTMRRLAYANHVTLAAVTAFPAVAGLKLIARGAVPAGVHGPEVFDPAAWLQELDALQRGLFDHFEVHDPEHGTEPRRFTAQQLGDHWRQTTSAKVSRRGQRA